MLPKCLPTKHKAKCIIQRLAAKLKLRVSVSGTIATFRHAQSTNQMKPHDDALSGKMLFICTFVILFCLWGGGWEQKAAEEAAAAATYTHFLQNSLAEPATNIISNRVVTAKCCRYDQRPTNWSLNRRRNGSTLLATPTTTVTTLTTVTTTMATASGWNQTSGGNVTGRSRFTP